MYGDEFQRTAMLFGADTLELLAASRVAVFGIGGVGGNAVEALARSGIGKLELFDNDIVTITNINRQTAALHSTVGKYKTEVMRDRILDINPNASVACHNIFYMPETADEYDLCNYDFIIDAVDTVTAKLEIITRAARLKVPVISCMGTGNKTNPMMLEIADVYDTSVCPLARVMRRELKKRNIGALPVLYSKEEPVKPLFIPDTGMSKQPPASSAFVPPVAGIIIASYVVKRLIENKAF